MADNFNLKKWRRLCYVQAFFGVETFTAPILVLFYTRYAGFTFTSYSLLMSLIGIFLWFFEVPTGAFADRFGRKLSLIIGNCIYLVALAFLLCFKSEASIFLLAGLFALGGSLSSGPFQSMMYQSFAAAEQEATYHTIVARGTSVSLFGAAIAAALGGVLAEYSISLPMVIDMIALAIVTLFLALNLPNVAPITHTENLEEHHIKSFYAILVAGIKQTFASRALMITILLSAVSFACLRAGFNFYQPMLSEHNVPLYEIGLLFSVFLLLSSGVAYLFSHSKKIFITSKVPILLMACLISISAISAYLTYITTIVIAIICHQIVRGMSPSYFSYSINREIHQTTKSRTTILSVASLMSAIFASAMMYGAGVIAENIGFSQAFVLLSAVSAILLIIGFIFLGTKNEVLETQVSTIRD